MRTTKITRLVQAGINVWVVLLLEFIVLLVLTKPTFDAGGFCFINPDSPPIRMCFWHHDTSTSDPDSDDDSETASQ